MMPLCNYTRTEDARFNFLVERKQRQGERDVSDDACACTLARPIKNYTCPAYRPQISSNCQSNWPTSNFIKVHGAMKF